MKNSPSSLLALTESLLLSPTELLLINALTLERCMRAGCKKHLKSLLVCKILVFHWLFAGGYAFGVPAGPSAARGPGLPPVPTSPDKIKVKKETRLGLIEKKEGVSDGYVLVSTRGHYSTYLIDNEGFIVHDWKHDKMGSLISYLLPNGNLLHTVKNSHEEVGDIVQELSWDGEVVWEYVTDRSEKRIHHDIERLSNGNTLVTVWERKDKDEYVKLGRDPNTVANDVMWVDAIYEVEKTGDSGGKVVWRWSAWEHLIQNFDENAVNFGDPSKHPCRIDLNQVRTKKEEFKKLSDWLHINSVSYDAKRDEIILSVHSLSEIWVVSRKTGKLVYRWGNPQRYGQGTASDQMLFNQHDPHFIEAGLRGSGNLLIFNNEAGRKNDDGDYSSVIEVALPLKENGDWPSVVDGVFPPGKIVWQYTGEPDQMFHSVAVSNAQRLPNGNTLITCGVHGLIFEVTYDGRLVWKYMNPVFRRGPKIKKLEKWRSGPPPSENLIFRAYRYLPSYSALEGRNLVAGELLLDVAKKEFQDVSDE